MQDSNLSDELRYLLLKELDKNPHISQRQLAEELGVSVGKINYCMKALIEVGHVKLNNFVKSNNKSGYAYVLTPKGLAEKAAVTVRFLKRKQEQYEVLKKEIEYLKREVK